MQFTYLDMVPNLQSHRPHLIGSPLILKNIGDIISVILVRFISNEEKKEKDTHSDTHVTSVILGSSKKISIFKGKDRLLKKSL